ncbi:LolA family protein [Pseudoalteromonas sp. T1lg10]|uniref:LolA family protein n=1 Tax=Pseudoalteromonas sp. T1lg10 TaxID=2077093 RepID=UPI000CF678BE|nr:outer membrane lipoprotein carrier protein LolA [Pseudoalteromonas sp. T1lg10]
MKKLLVSLWLTLMCAPSAAANEPKVQSEHGNFSQAKTFAGFNQPFISKGEFTLSSEQLLWHTLTPIDSLLKIDGDGVFERQADGQFRRQGQSGPYSSLLQALLAQDQAQLAQFFTSSEAQPPASLLESAYSCQQLEPITQELKGLFSHFISCLDSQERVRFIGLYEHSGTVTEISLNFELGVSQE